jgi:tetratricopeptide (TPR) repeat protein
MLGDLRSLGFSQTNSRRNRVVIPARHWLFAALLAIVTAVGASGLSGEPTSVARKPAGDTAPLTSPDESRPPDDLPEPLVPRIPRSEQDEDHLSALAHFSAGRVAQERNDYAQAIRHYQRAVRYDPAAKSVVWPIVALTRELRWKDVHDRYLLLAARLTPESFAPADLIELSDIISTKDDARLAIGLFDKAQAKRKDKNRTPLDIVLRWRLAELCLAVSDCAKAADCAAEVLDALERPGQFGPAGSELAKIFRAADPPYWLFGQCFLLAGRLPQAQSAFEKAHQKKPDPGQFHYEMARIDLARNDPAAALTHLEKSFAARFADEGVKPYKLLRRVLDRLGKAHELPARLEKLLAGDPNNAALAGFAADEHRRAGRLDKAVTLYETLLAKQPSAATYTGLIDVHRKQGRVDDLLRVLGQAVDRDAFADLGEQADTIVADKPLVDRLLAAAEKQLRQKPPTLGRGAALAAALLAMEAHRPDAAAPFFERAIAVDPKKAADVLLLWGDGLVTERRMDKAAEVFARALAANPPADDRPMLYYYLASASELAGQTDKALDAIHRACELKKDSALLVSHEGWILYHAGRYEPARKVYRRVIDEFDADHSSPGVRQVLRETRLVLSHLEAERGSEDRAVELLEQVLDEFPDDVSAMNDLGYLWADKGVHLERSLGMVRRAVEVEPDNTAYRDSLGWALVRLGRFEEAVAELEEAAADSQPEGEILDHLGEVYHKLGKTRKAAEAWRRAADAYRKANIADKATAVESKLKDHPPD